MPARKPIQIGERFTRLVVIRINSVKIDGKWRRYAFCRCDCGTEKDIRADGLRMGVVKSCGCYVEQSSRMRFTTHGCSQSKTYRTWISMRQRCQNPNARGYADYGGRGIAVCERWERFDNFLADMGECPPGLEVERKDNDKGYYKENCKWATRKEQQNNTRANVFVTFRGITGSVRDVCSRLGIDLGDTYHRILYRLRSGWSTVAAFTVPVGAVKRNTHSKMP